MGGLDMNSMQEEMMRNPQMMQELMNSPIMAGTEQYHYYHHYHYHYHDY